MFITAFQRWGRKPLPEEEKIVSTFDAIQELTELLGVDWETASQIYLFETEEDESDDQRAT